jgi:TRAP-type C4-dicarboxylate transport system permease small subunit
MRQTFLTVTDLAYRTLRAISVLVLAAYFVLVLLQVFFRYVLNESLFWSEEIVRYGLVWGVMLGSALVGYDRAHIRIEVIENFLPPTAKRVVQFVANALTLAFCIILAWTGIDFVDRTWFQNSASLGIPMRAVYLAIPIGAALEAWFTIAAWIRGEGPATVENEAIV